MIGTRDRKGRPPMQLVLCEYLASKVLADLREAGLDAEVPLAPELCGALYTAPVTDRLLEQLLPSDLPLIQRLCHSPDEAVSTLGVNLLKSFGHAPEIRAFLLRLWDDP